MQIKKRDGTYVPYNKLRVLDAVVSAMKDTKVGINTKVANKVADEVEEACKKCSEKQNISVEDIQDMVELELMDSERKDVAKQYILYRERKHKERGLSNSSGLLSKKFLRKYKHIEPPMDDLGKFVYYRTYSRWLDDYGRREEWWETVRRAVEYNCSLLPTSQREAEALYDDIFHLRQFPAGRVLWVGDTEITYKNKLSTMNCSGMVIDSFDKFSEMFYLLLVGSGVGFRILDEDAEKLPKIRTDVDVIHKAYFAKYPKYRKENTSVIFDDDNSSVTLEIGDSKEGWKNGLYWFFKIMYSHEFKHIKKIIVNYDNIRIKGEPLKTFGGYSSGYESLQTMFQKIHNVVRKSGDGLQKLVPINVIDISNIIAENVVVGGVRRSAELGLIGKTDKRSIEAKKNVHYQKDGEWHTDESIAHRAMSNNTILYKQKPTWREWSWHFEQMLLTGEPGVYNEKAALKRNRYFAVTNPCGEVLLGDRQNCNLTTVNVMGFVEDGVLNKQRLMQSMRLNARMGYRMTAIDLELPKWDNNLKRDRLCGVSHTGWMDMINATNMDKETEEWLLVEMKAAVLGEITTIAYENGLNKSLLATSLKPSGTLSLLPGVSAGLNYSFSKYYIRRVRVSRNDPLAQVAIDLEWKAKPVDGTSLDDCGLVAIEFPMQAPEGKTIQDVSAIEQLENYKRQMDNFVEHNASVTIMVRPDEWEETKKWVYDHWDECVALTFMPLDDHFYPLAPYEKITEKEYKKRKENMKPFIPSLVNKYEREKYDHDVEEDASCTTGACPVR